jgi:Glycosyl transferase family 2
MDKFLVQCFLLIYSLIYLPVVRCNLSFSYRYNKSSINPSLRGLQQAVAGSKFTTVNMKPVLKRKPDPKQLPNVPQNTRLPKSKTRQYEYYRMYDQVHNLTENPSYALHAANKNKYYLSIIAIFKNEACVMKEWLDHHIGHGVEHFYLVDDDSSDDILEVLKPYIDKDLVTMHPSTSRWVPFRQTGIYKKVFNSVYSLNESRWIAIIGELKTKSYSNESFC